MLSRSADALFWLNRYIERSEGLLRTLHTTYVLSLDKGPHINNSWKIIFEIFSTLNEEEKKAYENNSEKILEHILIDSTNVNSLRMILNKARENARGMQDHLTKEVWEQVNYMYHRINAKTIDAQLKTNNEIPVIESLLKNCLLYTGIVDSTMSRGESWDFMNLGKYLERCMLTIDLVDKYIVGNELSEEKDILYWRGLLFSLSGYEFHLKNYRSNEANYNVLHQAVLNSNFPHSVLYSLERMKKYLENIVAANDPSDRAGLTRQFGRVYSSVQFGDVDMIRNTGVTNYLSQLRYNLFQFSWSFSQTYFSYS